MMSVQKYTPQQVEEYLVTSRSFKCRAVRRADWPSAICNKFCLGKKAIFSDPLLVFNARSVIPALSLAAAHHESKGFWTIATGRL